MQVVGIVIDLVTSRGGGWGVLPALGLLPFTYVSNPSWRERVTNPWGRVYNQGRGSVWGLQAPSRGFGSRSNKVFIYLNIPTLSRGTVV